MLEGGWLLAVVLVTLYFNIYTKDSRIFEPQKALILRTLVTMMLAIWSVRVLEEHRVRLQQTRWWPKALIGIVVVSAVLALALFVIGLVTWQNPLRGMAGAEPVSSAQRIFLDLVGMVGTFVIFCGVGLALVALGYNLRDSWKETLRTAMVVPALFYAAVHLITTIGSVFPYASLYGGYVRQQGALTAISYIGLFFILAFNLRRREQVERLVSVILLASIPSALYGVVQKFGIDPLPWMGDVERRVASTMGNAIFIAAYLIMILPLTGYRLLIAWNNLRESPPPEKTPANGDGILGPVYRGLLWGGIGLALTSVLIFAPIALSVQQAQLRQNPAASIEKIEQIWPTYGQNLLLFLGALALTVALPALLYTVVTQAQGRWRPYAHLVGLGTAFAGAIALMFLEATRTNGFAWAGYLAGLCTLALLSRWQHIDRPWGRDALWADASYIVITLQSLFLFLVIKAYLPSSPYPNKWPLYLVALFLFLASCYLLTRGRVSGRVGYLAQVGGYLVLAAIQVICIGLTQSRGPYTGLLAGAFAFALVWTWRQRIRWALGAVVAVAVVGALFLLVFNLPDTPLISDPLMRNPQVASFVNDRLEPLKEVPYLGRLGRIFDASSGTGKVRILIWFGDEIGQGSIGMIKAHPLRTLIGYGPEAMHVAYNPYYPPELAHVEKRNASPDRAHDAIIDELVTMGALGLAGYLFYFVSFFVLAWQLLWKAPDIRDQALAVGLFSLGVAHFVETLTGIPIVATRMYMWIGIGVATALTFMEPYRRASVVHAAVEEATEEVPEPSRRGRRGRRGRRRRALRQGIPTGWTVAYVVIIVGALILAARVHMKPMWADILFWRAKQMEAQSQAYQNQANQVAEESMAQQMADKALEFAEDGLQSLHRAISLMPQEDFYYLSLAQVYLNAANRTQNAQDQQAFFQSTERAIDRARDRSPLNTDHYRNFSALYLAWYMHTQEAERLNRALAYGEQAISLTRNNADLRNRLVKAYLTAASSGPQIRQSILPKALDWLENWEQYHDASGGRPGDTHLPLVEEYRRQAAELLQAGNVRRGLLVLSAAELQYSLFLDEKYDDTYLLIGDLYRDLNMPDEAARMYGTGVSLEPNLLSDAQAEARIRFLADAGVLDPLITGYEEGADRVERSLVRLGDEDKPARRRRYHRQAANSYQALGYIFIVEDDPERAIEYYQRALEHRKTLETHKNLAILYQQTGQFDQAIAHAEAARDIAQKKGKTNQAETLQTFIEQVQQLREQLEQAEAYVAANPADYRGHYNLAQLYKQIGQMDAAVEEARLAAEQAPADQPEVVRQTYTRLGNYAFQNDQYDLAEQGFLGVLEVAPDNFNAHYKLARIYRHQGRIDEALEQAEAALAVAPEDKQANAQNLLQALRQLQEEGE